LNPVLGDQNEKQQHVIHSFIQGKQSNNSMNKMSKKQIDLDTCIAAAIYCREKQNKKSNTCGGRYVDDDDNHREVVD